MLYRRGNVWWLKFKHENQEIRESTGQTTKTKAREVAERRRREFRDAASGIKAKKPGLFRNEAKAYLVSKKRKDLAPRTVAIEESNLKHVNRFFGTRFVTDISADLINEYIDQRIEKDEAAPKTVSLEIGTLRAILRRAGLWEALRPHVDLPRQDEDDAGRALTEDEERLLIAACAKSRSTALLPAVTLTIATGLRAGELRGLTWADIDLERRTLHVRKSKTRAGRRLLPLKQRALVTLEMWKARFPKAKPDHFVFPSQQYGIGGDARKAVTYEVEPTKPLTALTNAWRAARKAAGVSWCRWHDLRHTFCTRTLEAGVSFPLLTVLMGWSATQTAKMAQRYGHVNVEALRKIVEETPDVVFAEEGAQKGAQSAISERAILPN